MKPSHRFARILLVAAMFIAAVAVGLAAQSTKRIPPPPPGAKRPYHLVMNEMICGAGQSTVFQWLEGYDPGPQGQVDKGPNHKIEYNLNSHGGHQHPCDPKEGNINIHANAHITQQVDFATSSAMADFLSTVQAP